MRISTSSFTRTSIGFVLLVSLAMVVIAQPEQSPLARFHQWLPAHTSLKIDAALQQNAPSLVAEAGPGWQSVTSPETAFVFVMTVKDGVVYLGTTGGIFASFDEGQRWERLARGFNAYATSFASMDNCLLVGTESESGSPAGLYRSDDSGKTWQCAATGIPNGESIGCLTVADHTVFAATMNSHRLYRSNDMGQTWMRVQQGLPTNAQILDLQGNALGILVNTAQGMFRSNDNGTTWTRVDIEFLPNWMEDLRPSSPTSLGNRFFVGSNGQGVWASDDGGVSWVHASNGLPFLSSIGVVKAVGETLYCTTNSGALYQSTDQGNRWQMKDPRFAIGQNPSQFVQVGASLLTASFDGGGVRRSTDGGTSWEPSNQGLNAAEVFAMTAVGNQLYVASAGGVWWSEDKGATWSLSHNGLRKTPLRNVDACALGANGTTVFAGIYQDGLYRTTNAGQTWERVSSGLPRTFSPYVIKTIGTQMYLGTYETGAYISEDTGTTWRVIDALPQDASYTDFARLDGKLYAATYGRGMFVSNDQGTTWQLQNAGLQGRYINTINTESAQMMIGTDDGIYRAADTDWRKLETSIVLNSSVMALAQNAGIIYAATLEQGILMSNDEGATWQPTCKGLPTLHIYSMTTIGDTFLVGTGGAGLVKRVVWE